MKVLASPASAKTQADRLVAAKLRKGYVEVANNGQVAPDRSRPPRATTKGANASGKPKRPRLKAASIKQPAEATIFTWDHVRPILKRWDREKFQVLRTLKLPHRLPPPAKMSGNQFPHREAMAAAFGPRGFRGGGKTLRLFKKTERQHWLVVHCDVGTWSHKAHFKLLVVFRRDQHTLFGRTHDEQIGVSFPVYFHPREDAGAGYKITDPDTWHKMMENAAVVVSYLEQKYVPTIEDLMGP